MLEILRYLFSSDTNHTRCLVCGKKFEEGQTICKTESGKITCSLVELLTELIGP